MTLESIVHGSADFARNADTMRGLVAELREKLQVAAGGGGETSRARHRSHGKMLARQGVDLPVDPGTAFLELSPLAAHGLYGGDVHSASVITGVGRVSGRECVIVAPSMTLLDASARLGARGISIIVALRRTLCATCSRRIFDSASRRFDSSRPRRREISSSLTWKMPVSGRFCESAVGLEARYLATTPRTPM
jgi:hypothetical protein